MHLQLSPDKDNLYTWRATAILVYEKCKILCYVDLIVMCDYHWRVNLTTRKWKFQTDAEQSDTYMSLCLAQTK